jgi:alpha-ketoglutarate-dependent 2,4-dichlorophenoxyacetate dioxygenase
MQLAITRVQPLFAAKITGIDLGKWMDDDLQRAIERAMDEYAVCVLPDQSLDDERQVAFSRFYGPLEMSPGIGRKPDEPVPENVRIRHKEIFDISNLDQKGDILEESNARSYFMKGNELWHTDSSFRNEGAAWSMLHAKAVPPSGGETEFADTRAAYDALPDAMKRRLEGLVAEHSLWHSRSKLGGYVPTEAERAAYPSAPHKLVRRHPGSGRHALYIAAHASHIVGMPREEGQALLEELMEFATRPQFVYRHQWRVGDLVIWDNRCTMHRATPYDRTDYPRDLRRTTIIDRAPELRIG